MLKIDTAFLLGNFRFAVYVSSVQFEDPLKAILKFALKTGFVDSIIGTQRDKNGDFFPLIAMSEQDIDKFSSVFFVQSGQNGILKKAIQKYRLDRIGVVAPACVMDGVNKLQYYGIGCNWAKTRIALKIGLFCIGAVQKEGLKCELLEVGCNTDVDRNYITENGIVFEKKGKTYIVDLKTHYSYVNMGCKYCLNLSARGVDLTFVPFKTEKGFPIIVRSERGEVLINEMEKSGILNIDSVSDSDVKRITVPLEIVVKWNVERMLERAELKLPSNKWNPDRFEKFYKLWNSIEVETIDERML